MISIVGNNQKELEADEFRNLMKSFEKVILDIGTGDGRFVYKNALKNDKNLYIGLDPVVKQLEKYSKKAIRKKLKNILFVQGSAENIPPELFCEINKIFINLPWGTLLEKIVKTDQYFIKDLYILLKKQGELEITFGYLPELEPSETQRLSLPNISLDFISNTIMSNFKIYGFNINSVEEISKEYLKNIETTWSKKLTFGKNRKIYKINFSKNED